LAEARGEVARLEKQLAPAGRDPARRAEADRIGKALEAARRRVYEAERDARTGSPVYRELLNKGAGPPGLDEVRRTACGDRGLLLEYLIGRDGGYVVVVGPDSARLERLELGADE